MSQPIQIKNHHAEQVAEIGFDDDPINLNVSRTASGFQLMLPAKFSLVILKEGEPLPLISDLSGRLFANDVAGVAMEIGHAEHDSWHSGGWAKNPGWGDPTDIFFTWTGSLTQLAVFEKLREGRKPEFQIQLRGELCYLISSEHPRYQVRTQPQLIYGNTTIGYPKETWIRELRKIGVLENVLVEVPLPATPPAPWDRVWENLVKARIAFEQGGSTGWIGCVLAVRQALEKWKAIEGEEIGSPNPRQRSNRERLNNVRLALHQCTHDWIHEGDECSRDDALLMLSTLSALLAERKP